MSLINATPTVFPSDPVSYTADALPNVSSPAWAVPISTLTTKEISPAGQLHLKDLSGADRRYFAGLAVSAGTVDPVTGTSTPSLYRSCFLETSIKVVSNTLHTFSSSECQFINFTFSNGSSGDSIVLSLWSTKIEGRDGFVSSYLMDTTDAFHTYRVEQDFTALEERLYVDGTLRATATFGVNESATGATMLLDVRTFDPSATYPVELYIDYVKTGLLPITATPTIISTPTVFA